MYKFHQGFTLLEMMAVIAVIGILAAMAVPSFQGRIVRQQIEAALPLADVAKKPVAAAWTLGLPLPVDNAAAGLPAPDKIVNNYISSVSVQDGVIQLVFGNRAHKAIAGKTLTMRPAVVADTPVVPVSWVCGKAEAPDKMTVKGVDQTSIPVGYLPLECKALKH